MLIPPGAEPNTPLSTRLPSSFTSLPHILQYQHHLRLSKPSYLQIPLSMFWWFANSPGTTNHHIPDVLPGVWGELATDGNRWNEDINRAAYRSLENPPPVGKSPIPSTPFSNDIVLPAVPIATHIPFRIREEKLRRKYTRYGDAFPNEENKALWARLGVVTVSILF